VTISTVQIPPLSKKGNFSKIYIPQGNKFVKQLTGEKTENYTHSTASCFNGLQYERVKYRMLISP
jgi:hypothetical protein